KARDVLVPPESLPGVLAMLRGDPVVSDQFGPDAAAGVDDVGASGTADGSPSAVAGDAGASDDGELVGTGGPVLHGPGSLG
ncbi:MAG: hypothetical protein LBM66_06420, partial [Bifidobacteriaceae bacterium]|nr:hypothetical protein [Bifidobacteriaceae bacterium]